MKRWCFFALLLITGQGYAEESMKGFYASHGVASSKVSKAQKQAVSEDKLLLLVIGADWCHDSRALAEYLQSPEVSDVVENHFEPVILDAGWLSSYFDTLAPFGHPAYFGTPTVLVVSPEQSEVLNRSTVQRWQSAASESSQALATYLSDVSQSKDERLTAIIGVRAQLSSQDQRALVQFENSVAQKIYAAYLPLGEMLRDETQGNPDPGLNALWKKVKTFRIQAQNDLVDLHSSAVDSPLTLPEYSLFADE